jgi:AmmeMemoRadiSam system protein A
MKEILLELAKKAILEELNGQKLINKDEILEQHSFLKEDRAVFVTLTINGSLRGCIGSILPQRALIDDIISNAKNAAFNDPRFSSLTKEEFEETEIEVSILTIPQRVEYDTKEDLKHIIRPNVDGVILSFASYQATFLPDVWEQLPLFELFFSQLCMKAGMNGDCLKHHPVIYTYQTEIFK